MKTQVTTSGLTRSGRWIPMTPEAFRRLEAEADRLVAAVGDSQSTGWAEGFSGDPAAPTFIPNGELHVQVQRLGKLRSAIGSAHVVRPNGRVLVGSRITVRDSDGSEEVYVLVAPGQADARAGCISPDSPLGAALLGQRAGDTVDVATSAGRHRVTVMGVE
jgi:transcription elongation GreA/GreB family factor